MMIIHRVEILQIIQGVENFQILKRSEIIDAMEFSLNSRDSYFSCRIGMMNCIFFQHFQFVAFKVNHA